MSLSLDDYKSVARIHVRCINRGFLSSLGPRFLALLYEAIDLSSDGVLIVVRAEGQIVGFVAGARGLGSVYKRMLRSWWRLTLAVLPAFLSISKIYRMIETVVFSSKNSDTNGGGVTEELLSICVLPDYRGRGYAEDLFSALTDHFKSCGVSSFKIVVGDSLEPAHRFYRRMGARPTERVEVHKGAGSVVYVVDVR